MWGVGGARLLPALVLLLGGYMKGWEFFVLFFDGIKTLREMDGGNNPRAQTERKSSAIAQSAMIRMEIRRSISTRRKFLAVTLSLCDSAGFPGSKIGADRKSEGEVFVSVREKSALAFTEFSRRAAGARRVCVLCVEVSFSLK